ncbi:histone PARylation factor 1-like isoform X4 [Portunus trituberculatus]|uniref:histone PARylation factor 1-like isoform X4 n=1 Tax=Portunus trituberculatus TaxID=210409 RepID=UPI001E1D10EA|nr:histone PARylation factor 1-like isoform X4 [Portunus trituberculatus]
MAWDLHVHGLAAASLSQWNEAFEETAKYISKRLHSEGDFEETDERTKRSKLNDEERQVEEPAISEAVLKEFNDSYQRIPIPLDPSSALDSDCEQEDPEEEVAKGQDFLVQDSPEEARFSVEQKFLLEMPSDFFDFWECCTNINKEKPEEALLKAGLTLVGPYDVLTGKLKKIKERKVSHYVCHWRYYYDPPEFMTVIAGDKDEFHIGYYRDDPFHLPCFVASMSTVKQGQIIPLGENIFAGVCSYLKQRMKEENPFKKAPLQRLYKEVESFAKKNDYSLLSVTKHMKKRNKKVVAKTFHGGGIVVPVENDVGYRELPETYGNLKKMLQKVVDSKTEDEQMKNFDAIQEIITNVQFAFDEGDSGTGIELGLNLFTFGGEVFHKPLLHLLSVGYDLLERDPFIDILQAHLRNRRRGSQMSILDPDS